MSEALENQDLQIVGAVYGLSNVTSAVIGLVNRGTNPQSLSVAASNAVFGDTWPNVRKSLTVAYRYGSAGIVRVGVAREGETLNIGASAKEVAVPGEVPDSSAPQLSVLAATYGPSDQTAKVQSMIDASKQELSVPASNSTFGDTWQGVAKTLVVVAAYQGQVPFVDIVQEGGTYNLKYRPRLRILSASYGPADVLDKVQGAVSRRSLSIAASNSVFGDTWPTVRKSLAVVYQYEGQEPQQAIAVEGSNLSIDYDPSLPPYQPPADPRTLNVIRAAYGPKDVSTEVTPKVVDNKLNFTAGNAVFGDTWPNVRKSFSLCYSWGPGEPQSCVLTEEGIVDIHAVAPIVPTDLVSLAGLFGDGDKAVFEASTGYFWAVDAEGRINASATSRESATEFTLHPTSNDPGRLTLSTPNGSVGLAADKKLQVVPSGSPAEFFPSVATTGSIVLGVAGNGFCIALEGGQIAASGSDGLPLGTASSLFLTTTEEGLENHLRAYGIDNLEDEVPDVSPAALKVAWDLTGGFFLAVGLGPALIKQELKPGLYNLLITNARIKASFDRLWTLVSSAPGALVSVATLLEFAKILAEEGLLWTVLRQLLPTLGGMAISWLVLKVVALVFEPAVAAVEIIIAFASWAYTTTTDVLAWVNSGSKELMPALA